MAARLAVVLSGGSEEQERKLGRIGEAIGIAFQIRDDILSTVGEEFAQKKGYGDDITEGKRSLLVIHTLQKAGPQDRKRLLDILNAHTTDAALIAEAIRILKTYGAVEYATAVAEKLVAGAWREADPLLPPSPAKEKLKSFLDFIIERKM
jgi:geranylgeranyl pyrophosphate synthase